MKGKRSRFYRFWHNISHGVSYEVRFRQTDLWIRSSRDFSGEILKTVIEAHSEIMSYVSRAPLFLKSLLPLPLDPTAPPLVQKMLRAASLTTVGPMAAVAGVISERVGERIRKIDPASNVIVENGGDCYIFSDAPIVIGLYVVGATARSPLSTKIRLLPEYLPLCVCTSSATIGHSMSLGKADAVTVFSRDGAYADAAATAICNSIRSYHDLMPVLEDWGAKLDIHAVVAIIDKRIGVHGNIEFVS